MHHHYHDITSRIAQEPLWYDEHAVPRYDVFKPGDVADIYADEVALVEIACQNCGAHFLVAFSASIAMTHVHKLMRGAADNTPIEQAPLASSIRDGSLHYGDPPNAGCCPAGPTMNCEDLRVCEYWRKNLKTYEWERDPTLEVQLDTIYGSSEVTK